MMCHLLESVPTDTVSKACCCAAGVLYHRDLTEKLKLLYKLHVLPGEFESMQLSDDVIYNIYLISVEQDH